MNTELMTFQHGGIDSCKAFTTGENGVVIRDPFGDGTHANVQDYIKAAKTRVSELVAKWETLTDEDKANEEIVKAAKKEVKEVDDALKNAITNIKDDFFMLSSFSAVETQFAKRTGRSFDPLSLRGKLALIAKEVEIIEKEHKRKMPKHSYVLRLNCTDETLKSVIDFAQKKGADQIMCASAQSDKAVRQIQAWFDDNL